MSIETRDANAPDQAGLADDEKGRGVIRVLVADDHPAFATGFSRLIDEQPDLESVGTAPDGETAVSMALQLHPDVVVMDISMPKLNGIEATRRIKEALPNTAVLMLSAYAYHPYVIAALEARAGGYLLKNAPLRELLNGVRALSEGETVLEQSVSERLFRSLARSSGDGSDNTLNEREVEVLRLAARGLSNKQIADKLTCSERTVQAYFTNIFSKLGVASRIEAVLRAFKEGWLTPEELP